MGVPGGLGWKPPAIADGVLEDKIRHADPIGALELRCPSTVADRYLPARP